jgi:hypothetical protein
MQVFDNVNRTVRDDLAVTIEKGSRLSVTAACFSIYAYWNMLYTFQKDAVLAIISKLEQYNGCILADMDYVSWRNELRLDADVLELLRLMIADITPAHDSKLQELFCLIAGKIENPINAGAAAADRQGDTLPYHFPAGTWRYGTGMGRVQGGS